MAEDRITVTERYFAVGNRTFMGNSLEPGVVREVPVFIVPPLPKPWSTLDQKPSEKGIVKR